MDVLLRRLGHRERDPRDVHTQKKGSKKVQQEGGHLQDTKKPKSADTLILDFLPPELWENKRLMLKPPSLWYFAMAAQAN